jgi:2-polyprenyl-3-methyl-5-hydroxy-6-metoxy-1,4-benzoquinol methylase
MDLQSDPDKITPCLEKLGIACNLIQGDVADGYFNEESFDLIVAISIFEHINDLSPVLERMHGLLRPSGQLLVGMPRVDRFMDKAFGIIGFTNINEHHVTDYKMCRQVAAEKFDLAGFTHIPSLMPTFCGLYFNMLFQKKS